MIIFHYIWIGWCLATMNAQLYLMQSIKKQKNKISARYRNISELIMLNRLDEANFDDIISMESKLHKTINASNILAYITIGSFLGFMLMKIIMLFI